MQPVHDGRAPYSSQHRRDLVPDLRILDRSHFPPQRHRQISEVNTRLAATLTGDGILMTWPPTTHLGGRTLDVALCQKTPQTLANGSGRHFKRRGNLGDRHRLAMPEQIE